MAQTTPKSLKGQYIDVTCLVGRVHLDPAGDTPAHVAAFAMIAEHDVPGEYHFPMSNGQTCVVSYEYRDTHDQNGGS